MSGIKYCVWPSARRGWGGGIGISWGVVSPDQGIYPSGCVVLPDVQDVQVVDVWVDVVCVLGRAGCGVVSNGRVQVQLWGSAISCDLIVSVLLDPSVSMSVNIVGNSGIGIYASVGFDDCWMSQFQLGASSGNFATISFSVLLTCLSFAGLPRTISRSLLLLSVIYGT